MSFTFYFFTVPVSIGWFFQSLSISWFFFFAVESFVSSLIFSSLLGCTFVFVFSVLLGCTFVFVFCKIAFPWVSSLLCDFLLFSFFFFSGKLRRVGVSASFGLHILFVAAFRTFIPLCKWLTQDRTNETWERTTGQSPEWFYVTLLLWRWMLEKYRDTHEMWQVFFFATGRLFLNSTGKYPDTGL